MAEVELYVYDLSAGFASGISSMLLGKNIDGIWHSGIVAFGNEFYFGLDGIRECSPGGSTTTVSEPAKIIHLGTTSKSKHEFLEFISDLSANRFALGTYNLITHNCNNFANEVSLFLVNKGIPGYILSLPSDIIEVVATNAFVGALVVAVIGKLVSAGRQPESDDFERLNSDVDEARKKRQQRGWWQ